MAGKKTAAKSGRGAAASRLARCGDEICEIGRRIYAKGFAAANDGNISLRLDAGRVLCTPTLMSKGFMKPSDLCIVDMEGSQLAGERRRSSEILLHLAILKERPDVNGVVHCHPPHATAFAVAREPIPQCVLPEVEIFLGDIPIAAYATPGTQAFADTVKPFVHRSSAILLANHGTVSFDASLERAYWWTEIVDAACRILILAKQLGGITRLSAGEIRELLEAKRKWGFTDPRLDDPGCEVCGNDVSRSGWSAAGVSRRAFAGPGPVDGSEPVPVGRNVEAADIEAIVRTVTEQVCRQLGLRPDTTP